MSQPSDALQQLIDEVAPGNTATDLGGWISHNRLLQPAGLVLRVHPPDISRRRLLAMQHVRAALASRGFTVPVAATIGRTTVVRCGERWAELEPFVPHERLTRGWDTYHWMFHTMGVLHRTLRTLEVTVPKPRHAVFATPSTLRTWARRSPPTTLPAQTTAALQQRRELMRRLHQRWVPTHELPRQLVHGDIKLPNLGRSGDGQTVYLDFGFVAHRPRIHDLAFSLTHTVLTEAEDQVADPNDFAWDKVPSVIAAYEEGTRSSLTPLERNALAPYTATVRAFSIAASDIVTYPASWRRYVLPNMRMATWLLDHPKALTATR